MDYRKICEKLIYQIRRERALYRRKARGSSALRRVNNLSLRRQIDKAIKTLDALEKIIDARL